MSAAADRSAARGVELLIEHCAAFDLERTRPSARERLELALGTQLAHLLLGALSRDRSVARFGSRSAAR